MHMPDLTIYDTVLRMLFTNQPCKVRHMHCSTRNLVTTWFKRNIFIIMLKVTSRNFHSDESN